MDKIELIETELEGLKLAFDDIEKNIKKYRILEDEITVKMNKGLLRYCANKIIEYTKKLYDVKLELQEV